ncbi:MAG: flagellar basal body-associated FliL family protein [Desulfohalobiaceae bacterium]|nr:flagellar basal body-associated FliL family protein [Desulfohalobiaceae bacterium]
MAKEKETQEPKKKSRNKIFLIGLPLLVLLIIGGGAGAYFLGAFNSKASSETGGLPEKAAKKKLGPLVKMEDFVVNIMHKDSTRFLKMGITLEVEGKESKEAVTNRMPQITDAVLLHVGNKRFDEIKDLQGKMQLKADLLARIKELAGNGDVVNLFFTDFVVQ